MNQRKASRLRALVTPFEAEGLPGWETEYPRPQLRRDAWLSLCGRWELSLKKNGTETPLGGIRVPFPPESRLSGVERALEKGEQYVYQRTFVLPEAFRRGRVLLHFGAVDQIAKVFVNGKPAGEHTGGYLPFSFDITECLTDGGNTLRVEVADDLDPELPYGKQRRDRGGMWYTPVSGIWQPVWLECVPENHIRTLKLTPTLAGVAIETAGGRPDKRVTLLLPEGERSYAYRGDRIAIEIENPILWTPERPHLYTFTLTDGEDEVASYFALRTVDVRSVNGQAYICLNGKPRFFHGLLDQGYYSDGIYLPAAPEGYRYDIQTMKALGFDTLRKHAKIEPETFYYYCDKYGMIVFQDMVNSGTYRFLADTALPTLGLRRGLSHRASPRRRTAFEGGLRGMAVHLHNHPCVCYYTIFNEGWGQYDADRLYAEMKALDATRVWDATSGWFKERKSDVDSEHVYFRKVRLRADPARPLVLSEFGGYSCKLPGHAFNLDKTYGYKKLADVKSFSEALQRLYREEIVPAIGRGLCGAILTQVSDVEDETNGLVTYDRQVIKVERETMAALADALRRAFAERVGGGALRGKQSE